MPSPDDPKTRERLIAEYFDSLPPPSPAMKKLAELGSKYLKDKLDRTLKEGDIAHRAYKQLEKDGLLKKG